MSDSAPGEITDDTAAHRYRIVVDGAEAGVATYSRDAGTITVEHTIVRPQFEGRGIGSALTRAVLDDARARGERVVAQCSFVASWIERHPDYADLVAGTSAGTGGAGPAADGPATP